jgi:hypothetical protein
MQENTVGFIQREEDIKDLPESTLTISDDQELKETYPANVEGSEEFNQANNETYPANTEGIKKMLSNPQIRQYAFINAQDIKKRCKGWFTVEQLARKLMLKVDPVQDMLNTLILFEFAYRMEHKGQLRYKIQFSKEDKIAVIREELEKAKEVVNKLEKRLEEIINN